MKKLQINPNVFLPMPVVLVGTVVEGRANFMTVGGTSRVNANPPMIAVGINRSHATHAGILENETFSVNVPHAGMVEKTDYCGLFSGKDTDKSRVFDLYSGGLPGAPMIRDCPLAMECRLVQTVALPTNTLFIGEIVGAYAEEDCLAKGRPEMEQIDPLILTMPDNRYWSLGECAGDAWGAGKRLKGGV